MTPEITQTRWSSRKKRLESKTTRAALERHVAGSAAPEKEVTCTAARHPAPSPSENMSLPRHPRHSRRARVGELHLPDGVLAVPLILAIGEDVLTDHLVALRSLSAVDGRLGVATSPNTSWPTKSSARFTSDLPPSGSARRVVRRVVEHVVALEVRGLHRVHRRGRGAGAVVEHVVAHEIVRQLGVGHLPRRERRREAREDGKEGEQRLLDVRRTFLRRFVSARSRLSPS